MKKLMYPKRKFKTIMLVFCLVTVVGLPAQTIQLNFPHFANRHYAFLLFQGDAQDTVARGVIPENGRVTLEIPDRYNKYVGLSVFAFTNHRGGRLTMLINDDEFSVECKDTLLNNQSIQYSGAEEGAYFAEMLMEQNNLQAHLDQLYQLQSDTTLSDAQRQMYQKELEETNQQYTHFKNKLARSKRFAAGELQILNLAHDLMYYPYISNKEKALEMNRFVADQLDWEALYTSGKWDQVINGWLKMNTTTIQDDQLLLNSLRGILERISNMEVYGAFADKFTEILTYSLKEHIILALSSEIAHSGKLLNFDGWLYMYDGIFEGDTAIPLTGTNTPFGNKTLLVFYGTDCGHCTPVMQQLEEDYPRLEKAGIKVISVANDLDSTRFQEFAQSFPWPDKVWDVRGFGGENFLNYGVNRTPALILIDNRNRVIGRYRHLETDQFIEKFIKADGK